MLRYSSDVNGFPAIDASDAQRQRLDIYKRQNSEFNRLQSNKNDFSRYDELNDQAPNQSAEVMSQSESRRFGLKKRPCVPVYPNHGNYDSGNGKRRRSGRGRSDGRTLYDLNFYFLGYQPDYYHVNPATQTVSAIGAVDNNRPVVSDNHYDHYGGYYDCEPNPFYRPPFGFGSGNGALYNDDPNRPSYFGQLGQNFFDFINGLFGYGNPNAGSGGYDTPVSAGSGAVLNDENAEKPVFEINVPDTIAALVKRI